MPLASTHVNLQAVKSLIASNCAINCVGDSRTEFAYRSVPGQIFRQWDIKFAAIVFDARAGYICTPDGELQFQTSISMTNEVMLPGDATALKFSTIGAYVGTPFVANELFGNNAVQGLATKTAFVNLSDPVGKLTWTPVTGTFANGDALFGYTGSGTTTITSIPVSPGSGITNRYPVPLGERWVPGTGNLINFAFGFCYQIGITADNTSTLGMYASATPTYGGTFKRGHPTLGRNIDTLEVFEVATNSGNFLAPTVYFSYNLSTSFTFTPDFSTPPTAPTATPVITAYTTSAVGTTGIGAGFYIATHSPGSTGAYDGKGMTFAGFRINFAGGDGCILYACAHFAWQLTDHLTASPTINSVVQTNNDWKYDDTSLADYYTKCIRHPRCLIRLEIGANPAGSPYEDSLSNLKEAITLIVNRHIAAATAGGATTVLPYLVPFWDFSTVSDGGARSGLYRQAMRELAISKGWAYYDLVGELQAGRYSEGVTNTVLASAYRFDSGHVNFDGMNLLGALEWAALSSSTASGGSRDDPRLAGRRSGGGLK